MGMRGINATPKPRPKRVRESAKLVHPWDLPGLSRAERVIRFVETLPCTQGPFAGTTLKLRPWQKRFLKAVYRTDKKGNRSVRTAVLSVGRKNGKTQLAAALCLCALSGPEAEPRGECYSVACTTRSGRPDLRRNGRRHRADAVAEQAHQYHQFPKRAGGHGQRLDIPRAERGCRARAWLEPVVSSATTSWRRCQIASCMTRWVLRSAAARSR